MIEATYAARHYVHRHWQNLRLRKAAFCGPNMW